MNTNNRYLEKIAVDWGGLAEWAAHHAGIGAAVHVAQNMGTRAVIGHVPAYRAAFRDYFHAGLQGKGFPSKAATPKRISAYSNESEFAPSEMGQEATHLANTSHDVSEVVPKGGFRDRLFGALNPELKVILEEAHAAGAHAREGLLAKAKDSQQRADSAINAQTNKVGLKVDSSAVTREATNMADRGASIGEFSGRGHLHNSRYEINRTMNSELAPFEAMSESKTDAVKRVSNQGLDSSESMQGLIGKKSTVIYARALRGDFVHLHDMAKRYPHMHEPIRQHLLEIEKRTHHPLTSILQSRSKAQDVETAYKNNPITGRLFSSLADKPTEIDTAKSNLAVRGRSMMQGAAMTAVADPLAGALNASKIALSDKSLLEKSPIVKKTSDWLTSRFVVKPILQAGEDGLYAGKRHGRAYQLYNKYLMNNALGHVEDAVNSTSHAAGKYTQGIRKALSVGEDVQ